MRSDQLYGDRPVFIKDLAFINEVRLIMADLKLLFRLPSDNVKVSYGAVTYISAGLCRDSRPMICFATGAMPMAWDSNPSRILQSALCELQGPHA